MPPKTVLFTDLDGTFLDHETYEPGESLVALADLRDAGVPVVFCSAKTRSEQADLRRRFGVTGPFIVENGAAVCGDDGPEGRVDVAFGMQYHEVRRRLRAAARDAGVAIRGYGDMTRDEVVERTGLATEAAERAMDREFTETFVVHGGERVLSALREACTEHGIRLLRGARFWTALGDHDKGRAVRYVIEGLAGDGPKLRSFAVGDYRNDLDMLGAVDVPMLVQRPDGTHAGLGLPGLVLLDGVGPAGWLKAARIVLGELHGLDSSR